MEMWMPGAHGGDKHTVRQKTVVDLWLQKQAVKTRRVDIGTRGLNQVVSDSIESVTHSKQHKDLRAAKLDGRNADILVTIISS